MGNSCLFPNLAQIVLKFKTYVLSALSGRCIMMMMMQSQRLERRDSGNLDFWALSRLVSNIELEPSCTTNNWEYCLGTNLISNVAYQRKAVKIEYKITWSNLRRTRGERGRPWEIGLVQRRRHVLYRSRTKRTFMGRSDFVFRDLLVWHQLPWEDYGVVPAECSFDNDRTWIW